jgi:hypothetical protein
MLSSVGQYPEIDEMIDKLFEIIKLLEINKKLDLNT